MLFLQLSGDQIERPLNIFLGRSNPMLLGKAMLGQADVVLRLRLHPLDDPTGTLLGTSVQHPKALAVLGRHHETGKVCTHSRQAGHDGQALLR